MMKKLILFLLLFIMIISSTSYAQERADREGRQKRTAAFSTATIVTENRTTIKTLADEVRVKTNLSKQRIKVLLERKDELSTEQLKILKNSIVLIKETQEAMKTTMGQINAYNNDILAARQAKDFDTLLILYRQIIKIQNIRINQLTRYNQILDTLLNTL
ncbi:MAG: hypothetical protein CVV02_03685 [Firmicutes bacterium HGW-Firmicutes-7]|nr:MAG: hypothetical protein CVV02_03685 [Firmicutes bacterium HGW-Firmicutes-7]